MDSTINSPVAAAIRFDVKAQKYFTDEEKDALEKLRTEAYGVISKALPENLRSIYQDLSFLDTIAISDANYLLTGKLRNHARKMIAELRASLEKLGEGEVSKPD